MTKIKRFPPWTDPSLDIVAGMPDEGQGLRYLIRFLNRAFTRLIEIELGKHVEITYAQWNFLRVLWDEDGLSQRELSLRAGLMENTTLAALNILEQRGWIRRERDEKDKRRWSVYLTPKGREIHSLQPVMQSVNRRAVVNIPKEDIALVRQTLRQMLTNLEDELEVQKNEPADR